MATQQADTRRRRALSDRPASQPAVQRAALGPTTAITLALAVGCFVLALTGVELVTTPKPLPAPLPGTENQDAESALYVISFALILPAALVAVPRVVDAIAAGPNESGLTFLAPLLVATLAASILLTRALPGGGSLGEASGVVGTWLAAAVASLARARQARPWDPLLRLAPRAGVMWVVAGVLLLATPLAFSAKDSISPLPLAVAVVAVPAVLLRYTSVGADLPRLPRPWGAGIDGMVIVLILLAIPDLVIFRPVHETAGPVQRAFETSVLQWHQDYVLGPANVLVHGGAMLVDTASQYGVASIYFLAAWFKLTHIGYGTLGLLDGVLFALLFAAAYCVLRLAGAGRLLAAVALALGVIVLIYNLVYPVGGLPAQHGPLRFGLPMLVILAAVAGAARPRWARPAWAAQLATVGLASIWALEAFVYTAFTFAAIICFMAWTGPQGGRTRWLLRRGVQALAACVAAQLLLIGGTLGLAGQLPDYGWYFAFLHSFLAGSVGDITYDFSPWSAGLAVGCAYAAAAGAFILLVRRRPDVNERARPALIALAGTTAYGIALFSYFDNRSADHILPYVSLPALIAGTVWLSLLLRGELGGSRSIRVGGLAFALALSVLLTSVAWSSIDERFSRSALGHVVPGGKSVGAAISDLWNLPALDRRTPQGEYLLGRYMPGQSRVLTLVSPDLENEILMRSGRRNRLPLGFPTEDSYASSQYLPALRRSVNELHAGDRLLTQTAALGELPRLRARPARDILAQPISASNFAPLQRWVLRRIDQSFHLRVIHRDNQGFAVAVLLRR